MKKFVAPVAAVLAASLATAGAQQTTAPDAAARAHQDIASLIPAHTVALARLASIDQALQYAVELTKAAGKDATDVTVDKLIGVLWPVPGKRELIDRRLPIVVAVSLPRATPPAPVMLLPMTDPAAYAASLAELGMEPAVAGSYVAVPLAGKYVKPTAPSPALNELPHGAFAVYANAEKLTAAFGPALGAALAMMRGVMIMGLASEREGVDGEAFADAYVEGMRAVLRSAKTLRFCADHRDGKLDLFATLQVKPGSELDGWGGPPFDAAALARSRIAGGSLEALCAADWKNLWPRCETMLDVAIDVYPKPLRAGLRDMVSAYTAVFGALGPVISIGGDMLTRDGMSCTMCVAPDDVATIRPALDALFGTLGVFGVTTAAPRTTETAGATITDYELAIDFAKLAEIAELAGQPRGADRERGTAGMQALLGGPTIPIRVATKNGRGVVAVGKQTDAATLAALDGEGRAWSKPMQEALARVADCNPVFVERIDLGAMMVELARIFRRLDATMPIPELPADASVELVFSAGVRGDEWRAGFVIDAAGFARLSAAPMQPR